MVSRLRWRAAVLWLVTLGLIAYAVLDHDDADAPMAARSDAAPGDGRLQVGEVSAAEVNAGEAIVVEVLGAEGDAPIEATVGGDPAEVLARRRDSIVVQVPPGAAPGTAGLRVIQGDRRSKGRDLQIQAPHLHRMIRNLIGGLAVLLLGVRLLSQGMRRLAGRRLRDLLAVWTKGRPRAVASGVVLGGLTQLTTSASTVTVGMFESGLIGLAAAVALLLGAQLGAAIAGALLPLALARESLFVVAIGMTWVLFASDKREGGIGSALLGTGLVLYGLHLLQTGFQPLASSPQLLSYIGVLERNDVAGWLACAAIGTGLAATLQGPGPVFWLVVGLVQTTGALPLPCAMAVLAGSSLGAAIATLPIALASGPRGRRLAVTQLAVGAIGSVVMLATGALWLRIADFVVPGAPEALAYGKKVLLPHVALHLGVSYVAAQVSATVAATLALPWLVRRSTPAVVALARQDPDERRWLIGVLRDQAAALESTLELSVSGDRGGATAAERTLASARATLEALPATATAGALVAGSPWQTALAALQLQRALEALLHLAELAVERDLVLGPEDVSRLRAMHALCAEGMTALADAVRRGESPDPERVRAREIRLNAFEAEGRRRVHAPPIRDSVGLRLGAVELLDAYEGVGNHIFRVAETLDRATVDLD